MAIRIAVSGATGRMGRALASLVAAANDLTLVGGIARVAREPDAALALGFPRIESPAGAAPILAEADVLIDFSSPDQLARVLEEARPDGVPGALVIGTTGLDDDLLARLDEIAASRAVMAEANFSVGIQVLTALATAAAAGLPASEYDVEIVETHHRAKADAPSGTALSLARAVALARSVDLAAVRRDGRSGRTGARPDGEIGLHALRGGSVIGEHRVLFLGQRERIELAHAASDRAVFAEGALVAARWLAGRAPGRYTFREALGLA
ncbi:MAG TPA: 4-hydroxy-tetrahydrodipicolinate reductase [Longimicrobiales bacterium]|nr:4-hydroxy-tetrahydrodipicolinate reductase [Longimicrobiales bacterium]